jgi:hypothetical protein
MSALQQAGWPACGQGIHVHHQLLLLLQLLLHLLPRRC